jgi:outer membrane protein, heavy metal efflux system
MNFRLPRRRRASWSVLFVALCVCLAFCAEAKPKTTLKPQGFALARNLESAVAIDAQSRALEAQRRAVGARYATSNSLTPGSPYISGLQRKNTSGNLEKFSEVEVEAGMPLWLPGERDAFEGTVTTGLLEVEERMALRRLDVAALVRDAWWSAQRAARELAVARDRVATARDIGADMERRVQLGDAAPQDALLARNELLAAETELAQVEATAKAARAAYGVLTGGAQPDGTLEGPAGMQPLDQHPALRAPSASLARAQSQARLAEASFIDSPEVGVFGRREQNLQVYGGGQEPSWTDSTTFGVRVKIPLPTPGRNEPKIAEAQAESERARAEYERAERIVKAEIAAAKAAVAAARRVDGLAANRLKVANEQFDLARKAFRLGESTAADLYRVRQLQLDAQRTRAAASIDLGVAQSRLNQAYGYAP